MMSLILPVIRMRLFSLAALAALMAAQPTQAKDLDTLSGWMQGSFDSKAQAEANPDYYPITLHMQAIWPEAKDGPWLYVEQAVASSPDQPYRQRVYRLVPQADGSIAVEPRMDVNHVAQAVVYMAGLPLESNVLTMTVMATKMPLVGRG